MSGNYGNQFELVGKFAFQDWFASVGLGGSDRFTTCNALTHYPSFDGVCGAP